MPDAENLKIKRKNTAENNSPKVNYCEQFGVNISNFFHIRICKKKKYHTLYKFVTHLFHVALYFDHFHL